MNERIARLRAEILKGGPSLSELADFAMPDFAHEQAVRQSRAIEAAIAKGEFPVRVGNFIVVDKDTVKLSRPAPPYTSMP